MQNYFWPHRHVRDSATTAGVLNSHVSLIWRGGPNDLRNAYCDALRDLESDGIDVELHLEGSDGEVPIEDMMKYRYLLSLEGNDVATDLKWKLASGSVVLMPAPTAESWLMEFGLQPGVHYQQVDGPSDVPAKLSWLRANPAAAEGIAREARQWMAHFIDAERELALSRDVLRRAAALVDAKR